MANSDKATSVGRLAEFFPGASPVRLPVNIRHDAGSSEPTVIEFGTSREVLFRTALGLEFGEHVRVCNSDGSLDAEAFVVAMQLENGQMAVAAQFAHEVANWIVKP